MTFNEYAHFKDFTLKVKQAPIFYSPYMIWPIKRDRSTGFLFPGFGPNDNKGFYFGGSFFWAMTRSMDSTFLIDHWAHGWPAVESTALHREICKVRTFIMPMMRIRSIDLYRMSNKICLQIFDLQSPIFCSFNTFKIDNSFACSSRRQQRVKVFNTKLVILQLECP